MFFSRRILTIAISFFADGHLISGARTPSGPGISTTSGNLHGLSTGNITTFLGIRYAQPPVGNLRWRTALPSNTSEIIEVNATRFGSACGQLAVPGSAASAFGKIVPIPSNESEDCLFLNIWAPRNGQKLPVIVFIHGGGFQTGSAEAYGGDHIASTGRAIFVSINYRLNIWGFPSTIPVDGVDQNIAISDARLAIKWVAQNIRQFGGDPARIILTGHSAGAALVDAYVYAYDKKPIVVGHIPVSGTIGIFDTTPTGGAFWNSVASSIGCGNITNASQVRSLYLVFTSRDIHAVVFVSLRYLACAIPLLIASRIAHCSSTHPLVSHPMIR
jgi:carboxylesterase type B